jgi:hypothetical protein
MDCFCAMLVVISDNKAQLDVRIFIAFGSLARYDCSACWFGCRVILGIRRTWRSSFLRISTLI